jgi:hypothetical protein
MSMSNFLENELIDHLFRGRSYTAPTQIFVSLHSADPTDTGGSELASSNGYGTRPGGGTTLYSAWKGTNSEVTNIDSAGTGGQTANQNVITFPTCTTSAWVAATHFGLNDAATAGNLLASAALTTPKTVQVGDTASFAANALTITLD